MRQTELTSSMSATILQHKFKVICARNTKNRHQFALYLARTRPKYTQGAEVINPKAQISGSHVESIGRNRWAIAEPAGTPIRPANIATIPNLNDTL